MLSQALRSSSSYSLHTHGLGSSTPQADTFSTSLEAESEQLAVSAPAEDCLDTPKCATADEGDEEPFWAHEEDAASSGQQQDATPFLAHSCSIDDLCRSLVTSSLTTRTPSAGLAFTGSISSGGGMAIEGSGASASGGGPPAMVARSCPKPIVMPRRSRQGGGLGAHPHHEELSVFVPPHELAASSLLDPTSVADSLCRKGSAAIRLRAGVLRRTGFLEGQTEVLRPSGSVTALKQ